MVSEHESNGHSTYRPTRTLTPAQHQIVSVIYERDLVDYGLIAAAVGRRPRTVKMHVEQIARLLPGNGNPLLRVALYAERFLTVWRA